MVTREPKASPRVLQASATKARTNTQGSLPSNVPEKPTTKVVFPEVYLINPNRFVNLPPTPMVNLHQEEFGTDLHENILQLLDSLKDSSTGKEVALDITDIKRRLIDDHKNRYYEYEATVVLPKGEQQKISFHIPALVNGRYLKLRGNHYILASQHFFRPITKTENNEVRLLSNSNYTIRLILKQMSVDPADLRPLLTNLKIMAPDFLDVQDDKVVFHDGSEIYFTGDIVYRDPVTEVRIDNDSGHLVDKSGALIGHGRYEFILDTLLKKIQTAEEKFSPFLKSYFRRPPYFQVYVGRIKLPLLYFLWSQKGLTDILKDFNIKYQVSSQSSRWSVAVGDKFINLFPQNIRQEYLVNGLLVLKLDRSLKNPDSPEEIREFLARKFGTAILSSLDLYVDNFIDPITRKLLELEGHPTDLYGVLTGPAINKLMNEKTAELADLKQYRVRIGEIIFSLLYAQLVAARHRFSTGKTNKLEVYPSFVIEELIGRSETFGDQTGSVSAGVLDYISPVNPVEEIMAFSRIIKTGRGGVRERRAFKAEHRVVHPTHYGNVSAAATPESVNVGLVSYHTLAPLLGKHGFYGIKGLNGERFEYLSISEALVPFQNQMMSDRLTMATVHARQVTPTANLEPPLVQTGAEYLVPQLVSPRFAYRAKQNGSVVDVAPGDYLKVRYEDGSEEVFDISPRIGRTKRGSLIQLEMQTLSGKTFKAGQLLAYTRNFRNDIYCSGKNVVTAVLNPLGCAFEDAYVINSKLARETTTAVLKELSVVVDPKASVSLLRDKLGVVENGEPLVEFDYNEDADYFWMEEDEDWETALYSIDKNSVRLLANEGEIVGIRVLINNRVDKKVHRLHKELTKNLQDRIKRLVTGSQTKEEERSRLDNVDQAMLKVGGHRYRGREFKGALITYYIRVNKPLREGDKLATRHGAKGVVGSILPHGPEGEFSGEIDVCISPSSLVGRQNLAFLKELYVGKIFRYLNMKVAEMVNDSIPTARIIRLITDLYESLCPEIAPLIARKINSLGEAGLRRAIKSGSLVFYAVIPPFTTLDFDRIKTAAELLQIPLEERVKIRLGEQEIWTEPVPVGVTYIQFLEHYSNVYQAVRGGEKYHPVTGAVTRGRRMYGGMAIGNLDCFALLTYDSPNIISELLGPRADHQRRKTSFYNSIITNGQARMEDLQSVESGGIYHLMRSYLIGLGFNLK